jgi:hypothetical protein
MHYLTNLYHRLKWAIYRLVDQLGWLGRSAAVIVFIMAGLATAMLPPLYRDAHAHLPIVIKPTKLKTPTSTEKLERYWSSFPKLSNRAQTIHQIMAIAKADQLVIDDVTYKNKSVPDSFLSPTVMELTVYDTYPNIHRFLNHVLVEMPYVGIESLDFSRPDIEEPNVDTRIRLMLYFVNDEKK